MKYYFKRVWNNVPYIKLNEYEAFIVGFTSLVLYSFGDSSQDLARIIMILAFGVCAILTAIDVLMEMKKEKTCNLFDVLRAVVSLALCVLSIKGMDVIFG